jgi:hypothetical protein
MTIDRVLAGSDQRGLCVELGCLTWGAIRLPGPEGSLCSADVSGTNLVNGRT